MTRTTRPVAPSLALLLLAALLLAQRTAIATIAADDADAAGGATAAAARPASTSPPPPLGTNLAAVTDWTAQYPFVNHMRMARTWWSGTQDQWEDGRALPLDAQGNVRALASNQLARTILFTGVPADPALLGKTFVVRYQGDGDLAYSNAEVVSRSKGRDVVRLASSGEPSLIIALTRTNRRKPLSNVHLAPLGGVCLSNRYASVSDASACTNAADYVAFENAGNRVVFMPEFLASLRPLSFVVVLLFFGGALSVCGVCSSLVRNTPPRAPAKKPPPPSRKTPQQLPHPALYGLAAHQRLAQRHLEVAPITNTPGL